MAALCEALGECMTYVICSPLGIVYALAESCFVCGEACVLDCRQAREYGSWLLEAPHWLKMLPTITSGDASGCHCLPRGRGSVRLEEGDDDANYRETGDAHISTISTQPKWSAVAALRS